MARTPLRPHPTRRSADRTLRLVGTTLPPRRAAAFARALVTARVAACVQVVPGVRSVYRWKGAVRRDAEAQVWIKTTGGALPRCLEMLTREHPYDVPEVIVLKADAVSPAYGAWVLRETSPIPVEPVAGQHVRPARRPR